MMVDWMYVHGMADNNTGLEEDELPAIQRETPARASKIAKRAKGVDIKMEGCIATPDWKACYTCVNDDDDYGCVIKEKIPLSLHDGCFILCGDYVKEK